MGCGNEGTLAKTLGRIGGGPLRNTIVDANVGQLYSDERDALANYLTLFEGQQALAQRKIDHSWREPLLLRGPLSEYDV